MKTIYIEPDEEIISVIDRIDRINSAIVGLAIPKNAQIWQSSINLKLLKREANSLNKKVVLVVPSDFDSEMAERAGFDVRKVSDIQAEAELVQEEDQEEETSDISGDEEEDIAESDEEEKEEEDEFQEEKNVETAGEKNDMINVLVNEMGSDSSNLFTKEALGQKKPGPNRAKANKKDSLSEELDMSLFSRKKEPDSVVRKMRRGGGAQTSSVWGKFFACFIALAVILAGLVFYFVLPTVEVEIYPGIETINFDLSVVGSEDITEVDADSNEIPLQEIKVEETLSKKFESTGKKDLAKKATGIITIYNEYSSEPQTLVATTRFRSPDGKIFRITENIIIPGAKIENAKIIPTTLDVEVVADQPGPDYNIEPAEFTIPGFKGSPKYVGFYGKSSEPMAGGSIGEAKVVLAEDMDNAENDLKDDLFESVKSSLREQIPEGFGLIDDTIQEEIIDSEFSAEEDEEAEFFTLDLKAQARALAYKKDDLKSIIDLNLLEEVDDNKKLLSDSQTFEWKDVEISEDGEVDLFLAVQENISSDMDIASLKSDLAGKDEVEARKYFNEHADMDIKQVKFSFWPFWVKKIPSKESRIKIITIYSE